MDIGFNITMGCDKACHFCYLNLDGRQLDLATFVQALDSNQFHRVTLSGGEPLMRADIWDFLREVESRGLKVNIITDGTFLTKEVADRLAQIDGLKLYISYHAPNPVLREKLRYAHDGGVSTHAHALLETSAYQRIERIFDDLSFVESVMILYPTNTGDPSRVRMFTADEWIPMIQHVLQIAAKHKFEVFYEPAFVRRGTPDLEKIICPAGHDPFLHVDGKSYPCCLLVDTEHGRSGTFEPLPFDYRKCPVLNVPQQVENQEYRRLCPLVFTDGKSQRYVFPSRVEELKK